MSNGKSAVGNRGGAEAAAIPLTSLAEPAQFRIVLVSFVAAGIGLIAGLVAFALYKLIGLFTNLFFFHEWSTTFRSVGSHHLGAWVILVPVVGAVLNSSINVAFQQVGHQTAKDYFRRLILEERYGEELVSFAIEKEIETLRTADNAATPQ